MEVSNNRVVTLYRKDMFSAWNNKQSSNEDEWAYFIEVSNSYEVAYFMLGHTDEAFYVAIEE